MLYAGYAGMNDSHGRRRSVDVGGLALALKDEGHGHGWGGWDEVENGETRYAEVLIDVRAHTETVVSSETVHLPSFVGCEGSARSRLIASLDTWHFEPHKLPEEEVVACTYILFEALYRIEGMQEAIGVPLARLATFLHHLRQVYRQGNSYHNFQHALDVFQATYYFLYVAGMVPPVCILLQADMRTWRRDKDHADPLISCLTSEDLFTLLVAAVGHDVGHPGLTNAFMKNAKSPLSVVYDDKSALEQMHYSLLLQIMRHNGLGSLVDRPHSGPSFRKLLLATVLGTDLGIHVGFMAAFQGLLSGRDVSEHERKVLVCQALIKCADISNPGRPYTVSKHWVAALESEWSTQLVLEKHLHLPASVKPSENTLSEAKGQVGFIGAFVRPLFELVSQGIPAMEVFAQQCRDNLAMWVDRSIELSASAEPPATTPDVPSPCPTIIEGFLSAFPPTLPDSFRASEDQQSVNSVTSGYYSPTFSSGSSSSHYESCESSPPSPTVPSIPEALAPLSPPLDIVMPVHSRSPSIASTTAWSVQTNASDATAAIRAAYKAGMRKKKSFHRSSWNPSPPSVLPSSLFSRTTTPSPLSPSSATPDGNAIPVTPPALRVPPDAPP
ncbi:HD-domain/PDEase-like protein [Amylocystis lapponica]|nr:HD-domain/PDEase-like protein [Amylocystis lapponica]